MWLYQVICAKMKHMTDYSSQVIMHTECMQPSTSWYPFASKAINSSYMYITGSFRELIASYDPLHLREPSTSSPLKAHPLETYTARYSSKDFPSLFLSWSNSLLTPFTPILSLEWSQTVTYTSGYYSRDSPRISWRFFLQNLSTPHP